ncbi:Protein N-terminal and lysine N-methyltransferase efm7 [Coemansia sp. RSA 1813]|nr:Protein N-terminal and lysine N-methyltransferase efm7 [Coemansia sp. RSA 1646]KAJ1769942.1 Protein N-terminal and lysine N-methyltransferase efm7 [Coemansia sp. RSA 1843]KAJ2087853.1 Protein N-terminal and lysine N-methyltransferase efm7 [Coemansia sp. RSA 986]KAJ2212745.1 Protein N-terminal and lysine N-methyltransferase efm7 [Coemansia sp. RSA 487]KAJ2567484.1 Protein N-terminal and lysine N-methyltransferase efm7 [Coemansia sp. RSA 1813]
MSDARTTEAEAVAGSSDSEDMLVLDSIFQEPEDFYQAAPEEKTVVFERQPELVSQDEGSRTVKLNFLGSHPLWGHYLWNAAKTFANYLDSHKDIVRGKSVLELGAAGALPSLISAMNGATRVVITDYPDPDLVGNIKKTVAMNMPQKLEDNSIVIDGFKWGYEIERIGKLSPDNCGAFDVLILCDLVFNHSEHDGLLRSVSQLMKKPGKDGSPTGGEAYVFFTHHRPWLADKDMQFIQRAQNELGLEATRVVEEYTGAMFEDDPGDERVRGTVHGFRLKYAAASS